MESSDFRPRMNTEKQGSALLWRREDDRFILLARHDMYVLNEFSKEVFDLCDGSRSVQEIIDFCHEKYGVPADQVAGEVQKLIEFAVSRSLMSMD